LVESLDFALRLVGGRIQWHEGSGELVPGTSIAVVDVTIAKNSTSWPIPCARLGRTGALGF